MCAERDRRIVERVRERRRRDRKRFGLREDQRLADAVAEPVEVLVGVELDARHLPAQREVRPRRKAHRLRRVQLDIALQAGLVAEVVVGDEREPAARDDLVVGGVEIDLAALDAERGGAPGPGSRPIRR